MNPKEIFPILKKAGSDWMEDQAPTLGAALAYIHRFFARSALNYSYCHRRIGFWARGRARSNLRATARPARRGERESDAGYGSERECEAGDRCCRDPDRGCDAAFWCIGCFRTIADLTQCNLGATAK
jgi:hypothetical protein